MDHYYGEIGGQTDDDYKWLYDKVVEDAPLDKESVFVELGVWHGRSVALMGVNIINSGKPIKFYAVDNFSGSPKEYVEAGLDNPQVARDMDYIKKSTYDMFLMIQGKTKQNYIDSFLKNIEPIKEVTTPLIMDSISASKTFQDKSIDFIFIDADHSYESVTSDIESWLPKMKSGGLMAGHDWTYPMVEKSVREHFPDAEASGQVWWNYINGSH